MVKREIVTILASTALIVLATGCATQRSNDAVASLTASDASRSPIPHELVGPADLVHAQGRRTVRRDQTPQRVQHPDDPGEGGPAGSVSTRRGNAMDWERLQAAATRRAARAGRRGPGAVTAERYG